MLDNNSLKLIIIVGENFSDAVHQNRKYISVINGAQNVGPHESRVKNL